MADTEKVLVWVHGDCLDPNGPALSAYPDAPAVFVFDDELLESYRLSAKRLVFIYECLLEIPRLQICRGDVAEQVAAVAAQQNCTRLATVESVAPRFGQLCTRLRGEKGLPVEILEIEPFLALPPQATSRLDLKRFSRYWQTAQKYLNS